MIDNLFQAIKAMIKEKDGAKIDGAKKLFVKSLYDIIDHRIDAAFIRRKSTSQERIAAADSINSTIKSTASTIKTMSALTSAPPPARDDQDWEEWMEEYKKWYDTNREEALKIK